MASVSDATRTTDGSGNEPYILTPPLRSDNTVEYGYISPPKLYLDFDQGLFLLDDHGRLSMTPAAVAGIQMQPGPGIQSHTDPNTNNMVWEVGVDDKTLVVDPNTNVVKGAYAGADGIAITDNTISGNELKTAASDAQKAADNAQTTADGAQSAADAAAAAAAAAQTSADAASASAASANAGVLANSISISGKQDAGDYATNTALNNGLALKEDKANLKALAYKDSADYSTTDLINKPDLTLWAQWSQLGDLATKTQADWNLDISNRPDLTIYELKGNLDILYKELGPEREPMRLWRGVRSTR